MKRLLAFVLSILMVIPYGLAVQADTFVNVALNMPVTTSPADAFYVQNFPASMLTDGQNSANLDGAIINYVTETGLAWFEIDLQANNTINQIKLVFQNTEWANRPKDYAIDVLSNGAWVRVVEQHNIDYAELEYVFSFAPAVCSKIRITGSNMRNSSTNFRLVELEAYSNTNITELDYTPLQTADDTLYSVTPPIINVALSKTVTTSTADAFYVQYFPASRLTDGLNGASDEATIINYLSGSGLGWYEVDLLQNTTITQVKLVFQNAEWSVRPKDYAIDVLSDNGWVRVVEQHNINYAALEYTFSFASVSCSKIRITGSKIRNDSSNFRLVELEAYNDYSVIASDYTPLQQSDNSIYSVTPPLVNVALTKTVTTSTADAFYVQNFPASRLTDGQEDQNMEGAVINYVPATGLAWYEIDLAQPQTITQIKLVFQNAEWSVRPKDYAIDVLSSGSWVRVVEQHNINYADLVYTFNFASVSCSKIRITASGVRNSSSNFRLVELAAFNNYALLSSDNTPLQQSDSSIYSVTPPLINLALAKTVTTSTADAFYVQNFPASRLTDGQEDQNVDGAIINYLAANGLGWYEINLQQPQTITQIKLVFQNAEWSTRPKDYAIDVLSNGSWIRVVEQHNINYADLVYTFNFASVSCSKIRITASNVRNSSSNFRLVELVAYNNYSLLSTDYTALQEVDNSNYAIPLTVMAPIEFGTYSLSEAKVITNITPATTVSGFVSHLTLASNVNLIFRTSQGTQFASVDTIATTGTNAIGTGNTVDLIVNSALDDTYTILIYGDVTGDGQISLLDLTEMKRDLLKIAALSGVYKSAGDISANGSISISDILSVKKTVLGI